MRRLTKIDVLLHKVGIDTHCFIYWSKPTAEEVFKQIEYNNLVARYRKRCIIKYPGGIFDYTSEFDMYLNQGIPPHDAWYKVMTKYVWK